MKRESWMDDAVLKRLYEQLEAERQAGIPSVPEKLMPEHIEKLLARRKTRRFHVVRAAEGSFAVAAMVAVLFLFLLPARKGANSINQSAGSAVMTAETSAASSQRIEWTDGTSEFVSDKAAPEAAAVPSGGSDTAVTENSVMGVEEELAKDSCEDENGIWLDMGTETDKTADGRVLKRPAGAARPKAFQIREYKAR